MRAGQEAAEQAAYTNAMNSAAATIEGERMAQAAAAKAALTRRQSLALRSRQTVQAASNGILIGDGSAQDLVNYTLAQSEQDAFVALYTGSLQQDAANAEGTGLLQRGQAEAAAYVSKGQQSLLSGVGGAVSNIGMGMKA
jgi:hypothetical protein